MKNAWYILIAVVVVGFIGGIFLYKHSQHSTTTSYKYAYIRSEIVEKADPNYAKYEAEKIKYENMQAQYEAEKHMRDWLEAQNHSIRVDSQALHDSYDKAYAARIALKEQENNTRLIEAYNFYVHKYGNTWGLNPTEVDLRIVNLQLQLLSIPFPKVTKVQKEEELHLLLAKRSPSLLANDKALQSRVLEAVKPLRDQLNNELAQYKSHMTEEMSQLQSKQMAMAQEFSAKKIISDDGALWQSKWDKKLALQKKAYELLYRSIQNSIQERSKIIAEKKGLQLKEPNDAIKEHALDITDAVIATYK